MDEEIRGSKACCVKLRRGGQWLTGLKFHFYASGKGRKGRKEGREGGRDQSASITRTPTLKGKVRGSEGRTEGKDEYSQHTYLGFLSSVVQIRVFDIVLILELDERVVAAVVKVVKAHHGQHHHRLHETAAGGQKGEKKGSTDAEEDQVKENTV